jgi:hypothetical protein
MEREAKAAIQTDSNRRTEMTSTDIYAREFPKAVNQFMRFQVGRTVRVRTLTPRYRNDHDDRIIGHDVSPIEDTAFALLGFGETLESAKRMAGVNQSVEVRERHYPLHV